MDEMQAVAKGVGKLAAQQAPGQAPPWRGGAHARAA
jgi:hypothetical protein